MKLWSAFLRQSGGPATLNAKQMMLLSQFIMTNDNKAKEVALVGLLQTAPGVSADELTDFQNLHAGGDDPKGWAARQPQFENLARTDEGRVALVLATSNWASHKNDDLTQTVKTDTAPYRNEPSLPKLPGRPQPTP